jgi:hypothetical protein
MKTEVVMRRSFFGGAIRQKSKSTYFSATDLVNQANEIRDKKFNLSKWLHNDSTQAFIQEIEKTYDCKAVEVTRGCYAGTWVHPMLFMDLALTLSPKLKVTVYEWIRDELLKFRDDSGDSYKLMSGALFERYPDKQRFGRYIPKVALTIKNACRVKDWESATENQLKLRDTIHQNITLLCNVIKDADTAVEFGIKEALKNVKA